MAAEQLAHTAPESAVPQLEQKRPSAAAPQDGQVVVEDGAVMPEASRTGNMERG